MFILQEKPIDVTQARAASPNPANGALVTFEGLVRADDHQGHLVQELMYVADRAAVEAEGKKIMEEALSQFTISEAVCIQRVGRLKVGELAVWIGVWASHRDEAFQGCRYIIEEAKKRLLIWKKEFFDNGESQWVHGSDSRLNNTEPGLT